MAAAEVIGIRADHDRGAVVPCEHGDRVALAERRRAALVEARVEGAVRHQSRDIGIRRAVDVRRVLRAGHDDPAVGLDSQLSQRHHAAHVTAAGIRQPCDPRRAEALIHTSGGQQSHHRARPGAAVRNRYARQEHRPVGLQRDALDGSQQWRGDSRDPALAEARVEFAIGQESHRGRPVGAWVMVRVAHQRAGHHDLPIRLNDEIARGQPLVRQAQRHAPVLAEAAVERPRVRGCGRGRPHAGELRNEEQGQETCGAHGRIPQNNPRILKLRAVI
jgi:hypothetical protein